jgi:ABC-2 type transport system permease protein
MPAATMSPAPPRPAYRVTGLRVARSEWAKLWSLRSSWTTLTVALLVLVVMGVFTASGYDRPLPGTDMIDAVLVGVQFAQLAVGVLGVLVSAGEYTTGMIRSTMCAVPTRLPVLWSKCLVYGAVALVLAAAGAFAAFLLGGQVIGSQDLALSLGDDGVLRCLVGTGLYLALVAVLGVALGALVRNSAGGIAALAGLLYILPGLTSVLPDSWADEVTPYMPSKAGAAVMQLHQPANLLGPWTGLAVFAGWTVLALAAAAWRLVHTDV